jgi:hypothetical protein
LTPYTVAIRSVAVMISLGGSNSVKTVIGAVKIFFRSAYCSLNARE